MARSIDEMVRGDYVKTGTNRYEKIESIEYSYKDGRVNSWSVNTEGGRSVGMWNARSYHKASDVEGKKNE